MKLHHKIWTILSAVLLVGLFVTSCDSYKDDTPDSFVESDKDLAGTWQLSIVKRNKIDISESMDFSKFKLHLDGNGRYMLENRLPFPVSSDGTWAVDDPAHPFRLTFTEDGRNIPVDVSIQYPMVLGQRQLSITHSPGYIDNKYEYVFLKVD